MVDYWNELSFKIGRNFANEILVFATLNRQKHFFFVSILTFRYQNRSLQKKTHKSNAASRGTFKLLGQVFYRGLKMLFRTHVFIPIVL